MSARFDPAPERGSVWVWRDPAMMRSPYVRAYYRADLRYPISCTGLDGIITWRGNARQFNEDFKPFYFVEPE